MDVRESVGNFLIRIWPFVVMLTVLVTGNFKILGSIIIYKSFTSNVRQFFLLNCLNIVRAMIVIVPFVALSDINSTFLCQLNRLLVVSLFTIVIYFLYVLCINVFSYNSFVYLILSMIDVALLVVSYVYIYIFRTFERPFVSSPETVLAGLIIIIPLFAQVAYSIADAVERYGRILGVKPQEVASVTAGLAVSFLLYAGIGILYLLFPIFLWSLRVK